jgi:hypothetical protein
MSLWRGRVDSSVAISSQAADNYVDCHHLELTNHQMQSKAQHQEMYALHPLPTLTPPKVSPQPYCFYS